MAVETTTDLVDLTDAWLSPRGTFYRVDWMGHGDFETDWFDKTGGPKRPRQGLFGLGWAKLTAKEWIALGEITQQQLDAISDWHIVNERYFSAAMYLVK